MLRTWRCALVLPLASPGMTLAWLVSIGGIALLLSGVSALLPLMGASLPLLASGLVIGHRLDVLALNDGGAPARRLPPRGLRRLTPA